MMKSSLLAFILILASIGVRVAAQPIVDENVMQEVTQKGTSRVIIGMNATSGAKASASSYVAQALKRDLAAAANLTAINDVTVIARADSRLIEQLRSDPKVAFIIHDDALPPTVENVSKMMGSQDLWSTGHDGKSSTIVILDTGIDKTHPMLTGKVEDEACFSVTDVSSSSTSLCPGGADVGNGSWADTSSGSGTNCSMSIAGCEHGTHVAGIAVGRSMEDGTRQVAGIAPGANLISIQVFSRFDRSEDCVNVRTPCARSFISSQLRALQYVHSKVLDHLATGRGPRIVALNMSLGGGHHPTVCDRENPSYAREIQQLADDGVATFVAAGNDSYIDAVGFPGCISRAITIGALDDPSGTQNTWSLAGFSDRSGDTLVSLLTFGVNIRSSVPGGGYQVLSGTSMASPLAAGAYAILADAFPSAALADLQKALRDTGQPVKEPVSGRMLPAIRVSEAYKRLSEQQASNGAANPGASQSSQLSTGTNLTSPPAGDNSFHRFIIEVPGGDASEKLQVLNRSKVKIESSLNAGHIGINTITRDSLGVTTDIPITPSSLRDKIQQYVGTIGTVTPDIALPPSGSAAVSREQRP